MNTKIYEEASEWFVSFRAGDVEGEARAQFDTWMRTSPEHLRAYLEVAAIWDEGPGLDPHGRYDADALVKLAGEDFSNVVPLLHSQEAFEGASDWSSQRLRTQPPAQTWRERFARPVAVAASITLVALVGALFAWSNMRGTDTYATAVGEQRLVVLSDGSSLELNARSRVQFRVTDSDRRAELLEGQALFRVAKDARRPFIVRSDGTEVRAVGTEFDVKRRTDKTVVTVVEGRVAVSAARENPRTRSVTPSGSGPVMLSAGDQLTVAAGSEARAVRVDVAAATAWTAGRLVFDEAPLSEVVDEFNRYNRRQLVVEDIGIPSISGVFSSTDSSSLVNYFRQRPGVAVIETEDEIRVMRQ